MELTVKRGDFLNELTLMQGVVERKNTIPILSNILLRASDGHLSFTSTDLDLTLLSQAAAKVSRPGSVTVPARKLFDLIRNLPEADVALKLMENHYLGVTCQRSSFRLVAQPSEDFPTVPKVEAKKGISFPLDLWKRLTVRSYMRFRPRRLASSSWVRCSRTRVRNSSSSRPTATGWHSSTS